MKLVTGCAGFIGSHLTESLLERGYEVVGIDNFDPYYSPEVKRKRIKKIGENDNFQFYEGDIRNDLSDIFSKDIDTVYHLAAVAGVRSSIKNPTRYIDINVKGTANLLEESKDNVEHFVFASSSSVYGDRSLDELPAKEDMETRPIASYPLSKVFGENLCKHFGEIYGLSSVILRYFTVYGPRQRPDEAICKFTKLLLNGKRPPIYGDGEQTRDFTYVGDIVRGTIDTDERRIEGTYNLGSGNRISVNELVSLLKNELGVGIEPKHVDEKAGDVRHTWADISKARDEFGYEPRVDIEEGISRFVDWFKSERV